MSTLERNYLSVFTTPELFSLLEHTPRHFPVYEKLIDLLEEQWLEKEFRLQALDFLWHYIRDFQEEKIKPSLPAVWTAVRRFGSLCSWDHAWQLLPFQGHKDLVQVTLQAFQNILRSGKLEDVELHQTIRNSVRRTADKHVKIYLTTEPSGKIGAIIVNALAVLRLLGEEVESIVNQLPPTFERIINELVESIRHSQERQLQERP